MTTDATTSTTGSREPGLFFPGLVGVIAAKTRLSEVDGTAGRLTIAGYPVEEFASKATFEEVAYLLWKDELPSSSRLSAFRAAMAAEQKLAPVTLEVLKAAAEQEITPMTALRMAAGTLDLRQAQGKTPDGIPLENIAVMARFPVIVATYWRLLNEQPVIEPRADLSVTANYLYMISGEEPSEERVRGLDTYLCCVVDHGLNASTFTARVITSTGSDLTSALVGAIGALKGPLHGGAPGPALDMVFEIGDADRAEAYLRAKLDRHERLMGFGHRIYRVRDPRVEVLSAAAKRLYERDGDMRLYNLTGGVEKVAVRLLTEYYPQRSLKTNVEFYTALLLHGLGMPQELFTPTFAISRAAGWIAHCQEQRLDSRIIRPESDYIGPRDRRWANITSR
jgi:citrate synthase